MKSQKAMRWIFPAGGSRRSRRKTPASKLRSRPIAALSLADLLRAGHSLLFRLAGELQGIPVGGEVRAGEQDESGEKGPDHEPYGDGKRAVGGVELEPGEYEDVEGLGGFPEESGDDGGGQDGADGEL